MTKRIIIDVSPDGAAKVAAEGYKGRECLDATREIEKALGTTTGSVPTPEMHRRAEQSGRATR